MAYEGRYPHVYSLREDSMHPRLMDQAPKPVIQSGGRQLKQPGRQALESTNPCYNRSPRKKWEMVNFCLSPVQYEEPQIRLLLHVDMLNWARARNHEWTNCCTSCAMVTRWSPYVLLPIPRWVPQCKYTCINMWITTLSTASQEAPGYKKSSPYTIFNTIISDHKRCKAC